MATGYDDSKLDAPPTREGLDAVSGARPVWMVHCSHHSGMVNTEAIRRTGFTDPKDLPDVEGGFVERRADGSPTGFYRRAHRRPGHETRPAGAAGGPDLCYGAGQPGTDGPTSVTEPGIAGQLTGNGPTDLARSSPQSTAAS